MPATEPSTSSSARRLGRTGATRPTGFVLASIEGAAMEPPRARNEVRAEALAALCEAVLGHFAVWQRDGTPIATARASSLERELWTQPEVRSAVLVFGRALTRGEVAPTRWVAGGLSFELVAVEGGRYIAAWVRQAPLDAPQDRLSPAERRVFSELCRGASNKEIARTLGISFDTVRAHMKEILAKLGVGSRLQAARLGWLDATSSTSGLAAAER